MKTGIPLFRLLSSEYAYSLTGDGSSLISGFSIDSRRTRPGDLFFALPGQKSDGHSYIDEAITHGASGIVHSAPMPNTPPGIPCMHVSRPRETLSRMSNRFYGFPSRKLTVIGVTGTNGKTTTSWFLFQILRLLGCSAGLISGYYRGTSKEWTQEGRELSTPESFELHRQLSSFVDSGCTHAVVELTSHALSDVTARAHDLHLSRCVFTAMGRDHLDFHGSLDSYYQCKLKMCRLAPSGEVFMGEHNPLLQLVPDPRKVTVLCSGGRPESGIHYCGSRPLMLESSSRTLEIVHDFESTFLQENLALAAASLWDLILPGTAQLDFRGIPAVPGRGERFSLPGNAYISVDYAHNPLGFSAVLSRRVRGRKIALFGAAGDRDRGKRREMAAVADALCDLIILTDEDPFSEHPLDILRDLRRGITTKVPGRTLFIIPGRPAAFSFACSLLKPGDELFLLGKGHESSLRVRGAEIPWSDLKAAALAAMKDRV